jgi:leucyl/phenylalanyl-tRNA--protein transferase
MAIIQFPPLESADENGLLGIGGDLEVESLYKAYTNGIFPWPISKEYPLAWFSPDPRGLLFYDDFHLSKSFKKFLKKCPYTISFNKNFDAVILNCARTKRKHENSTWITDEIINAYIEFHKKGFAYSVEVYEQEVLVGGLYGVRIKNYVCGESMFSAKDNASKLALYSLMEQLHFEGIHWLDTQMCTPVVESMGGIYIDREEFIDLLNIALQ